ncbi:hypothetical protein [Catalinimonas niigatensis]|uniref:hypothetical protein n=1 Tax=Catalinimonas niigatensis TaxID=1397264 RepID=UPI0026650CF7|nr:hypothetical protein [Catalinimonas niigatensis]WPP48076.1 hypothetical protein PZB72_15495 [Catalinimonas niigatensis]
MVKQFKDFPLFAKSIIFFYTVGYLVMLIYHISEVINLGFFSRNVPFVVNIWYDALGFLIIPIVLVLLYARPQIGLVTSAVVMMITFIFDALIRYILLDESYANWFYFFEISFAILVMASFPVMRFLVKPKNASEKYYA